MAKTILTVAVTGNLTTLQQHPGLPVTPEQIDEMIRQLEVEMRNAADDLDFETAARLRDEVFELKAKRDAAPRRRDAFAAIRASK